MTRLRLREWRERRGLSIRDLATRAGVAPSTVWQIEAGRLSPTVAMLEKLAKALRVGVRDLLASAPRRRDARKDEPMRAAYADDDDLLDEEDDADDDLCCETCGEELDDEGLCPECDADDLDDEDDDDEDEDEG